MQRCGCFWRCFSQWANWIVRPSAFGKVICSEDFMLKEDPGKNRHLGSTFAFQIGVRYGFLRLPMNCIL
jgi:hypothetical protein